MTDTRVVGLVRQVDATEQHPVDLARLAPDVGAARYDVVVLAVPPGAGGMLLDSIMDAAPAAGLNTEDHRTR